MLQLLLIHILITGACLWSGHLAYRYIFRVKQSPPVIFLLITGLIFLTLIAQVLVLFIPLNLYTQLFWGIVYLLSIILLKEERRHLIRFMMNEFRNFSVLSKSLFLLLWILILLINAGPVMMDDTESYHMQSILWIREYGTVPGLVNLHERFGFNSSWFSAIALLVPSTGSTSAYIALNGVLSAWFCFFLIHTFTGQVIQNKMKESLSLILLLSFSVILWPLIRGNAATANYDFIATLLVFVLFIDLFFNKIRIAYSAYRIEWIIWPVFLFSVRIINFPFLLLIVFVIFFSMKQENRKHLVTPILFSALLIIPFLARNILISGFPFFPSFAFNFFTPDWKADPAMMEELLRYIKYYGRVSTAFMDIDQTELLRFPGWIAAWFNHLFLYDKIILITGLSGMLLYITQFLKNKSGHKTELPVFMLVLIAWLISWFFISPDPRFIYGLLLAGTVILLFQIISLFTKNSLWKGFSFALLLVFIIVTGYYIVTKLITQPQYRNWITAAIIPKPPVTETEVDAIKFYIPEKINNNWNARCYASPLPCLYTINPKLKARGKSIEQGFRLEK